MRLTQKIKSAIKLLKEVESDGEKCEGNYIHFNRSKYFVFKNNLYKTQKYNKPIGTIKNGRIVLKGSMDILKSAQHGIRLKSKSLKLKNSKPSFEKTEVFESPGSNTFKSPESVPESFEKKNSMNEPSETEPFESPFEKKNSMNEPESFESPKKNVNSNDSEEKEVFESPFEKKNVNSNESEKEVFESPFEKTEIEQDSEPGSEVEDSKKLPESSEEFKQNTSRNQTVDSFQV